MTFERVEIADGKAVLYLGDCLDVLPTLEAGSVDAVITDPPYGFDHYKTDRAIDPYMITDLMAMSNNKSIAVFGYPENIVEWCVKCCIVPNEWVTWCPKNKRNGLGKKLPHWSEAIAIFGELFGIDEMTRDRSPDKWGRSWAIDRGLSDDRARLGDIWEDPSPGWAFNYHLRNHPNEKPVKLMARLITLCSDRSASILDPFMGSGTTGVACMQLGRRFIGVEIEPRYFSIAVKRITAAAAQLTMF